MECVFGPCVCVCLLAYVHLNVHLPMSLSLCVCVCVCTQVIEFLLCVYVCVCSCVGAVCLQSYCLFNVCTVDSPCLMQCSYLSTFQNDSETPEGINPELMDRLMGEKEKGRDDDRGRRRKRLILRI